MSPGTPKNDDAWGLPNNNGEGFLPRPGVAEKAFYTALVSDDGIFPPFYFTQPQKEDSVALPFTFKIKSEPFSRCCSGNARGTFQLEGLSRNMAWVTSF